jgi:hypothetical protein
MTTIVPPESISVPLILHGILEQVCLKRFLIDNKLRFQVETQTGNSNNNLFNQQDDVGRYIRDKLMTLSMGKEHQKVKL